MKVICKVFEGCMPQNHFFKQLKNKTNISYL